MAELDQTYTPERMKLVLDSTRLGMWDWNPSTNAVVFDDNWASMLGVSISDLTMTLDDWSSRVHPDDIDACFADITRHIEGETDFYENIHRMRHADGSWVYILDRGKVVARDSDGTAIRFTGTHTDLTPLKKAEFEASLAIKSKDRFLSSMSHELRAPLHAIIGVLEQVADGEADQSKAAMLKTAIDSSKLLGGLVDDILDAAKASVGQLATTKKLFDLVELLESIHSLYERRFDETDVIFRLDIDPAAYSGGGIAVYSDKNRLNQILMNLISNAWKFVSNGEVLLSLRPDQETATWNLCVTDTGPGIADTEKVFEAFTSLDTVSEQRDQPNSTGLGLYICRELTSLLGLSLSLESTVGHGSAFTIGIPDHMVRFNAPTKGTEANTLESVDLKDKSILVVDDDLINRKVINWQLSSMEADVSFAKDGSEAIDLVRKQAFDIVLTDLHMPNMGGLRLTEEIRAVDGIDQPIIIVNSADSYDTAWKDCSEAGADAYLPKPFGANELAQLLKRVVT